MDQKVDMTLKLISLEEQELALQGKVNRLKGQISNIEIKKKKIFDSLLNVCSCESEIDVLKEKVRAFLETQVKKSV